MDEILKFSPCAVAVRKNPALFGTNGRPRSMADIMRMEAGFVSRAFADGEERGGDYIKRLAEDELECRNYMKMPLCFAETHDEFWEQFGFHTICDRQQYIFNEDVISAEMLAMAAAGGAVPLARPDTVLKAADGGSLMPLAHFVNAILCRRYGLFDIRSAVYYERLQKELKSTGGNLFQVLKNEKMTGYFSYEGNKPDGIREVVFENEDDIGHYFAKSGGETPSVMARIVNMPEMLKHISGNGKVTVAVKITDPVIAENDGIFIWYLDEKGSRMERVAYTGGAGGGSMKPEVTATIGEFTAFIFGYMTLKQNAKFDSIYLAGPAWTNGR